MSSLEVDGNAIDVFVDDQVPALLVDPSTGDIADGNGRACVYYGYTRDQLRTLKIWDINTAGPERVRESMARADAQKQRRFEFQHRLSSGALRDVEVNSGSIIIHGRHYLLSYVHDITDQKAAERQSRESEARYRELFSQMVAGFALHEIICDEAGRPVDYRFLDVNPAFESMTGFRRDQLIGRTVREVMPETEDYWIASYGEVALTGRQLHLTSFSAALARHFEVVAYRPRHGQFAVTFTDVTEQVTAESELRQSEKRFRDFFEHSPVPTWEEDYSAVRAFARKLQSAGVRDLRAHFAAHPDDLKHCTELIRVVEVNPASLRFYGANDKREFLATFGLQFESAQDLTTFADEVATLVDGGTQFEAEKETRILSGEVRTVILRISAISGQERTLDRVLVSFIDITERRRAEAIQRVNQTRLAALAELGQSPGLSVRQLCDFALEKSIELTNSDVGYLFFYSETTAEFTVYAWSEKALRQCQILDRQTTYNLASTGLWGEAVRQRRPVITNDCRAAGPWKRGLPSGHVPIARHLNLPIFERGKIVAVIGVANKLEPYDESDVQQLTLLMEGVWRLIERTQRDEALMRYNQRLSLLQELDRRILAAQSAGEIAKVAVRRIRAVIPCDEALIILFDQGAGVARALAHDHAPAWADLSHETRPLTDFALPDDDGRILRYYPDVTRLEAPDQAMCNAIEKGARSVLSAPLCAAGEQLGLINLASEHADAFSTEQHEMVSEVANQIAIGLLQARLREELRQHNAELERRVEDRTRQLSEANAELDSFAYSISHDLRAPLRALQGYSEILLEEHTEWLDDEGREFVERISGAARRMDTLVRDVLKFSRATRFEGELEPVRLSQALDDAQKQLEAVIAEKGATVDVEGDLPVVRVDRTVLTQAIANLLSNAFKFVAEGVIPRVRIHAEPRGKSVRLWIADNGIGIAPENHERVFAAFERLHGVEEYPGNGIGLAIVKKGVERMGGRVGVESALGHGSRFWIELPGA